MGWKSVSVPARAIFPFHFGSARSMAEVGSWLALSSEVLYTMTLTRAEMPTHFPSGELYRAGVCARVDGVDRGEEPLGGQLLERRRVLGEEHVGRRVLPLGLDLVDEDVLVVVAGVDRDPGLLLERRDQRLGGLDVLAAVEGDGLARPRGGAGAGHQEPAGHPQCQGHTPPSPHASCHRYTPVPAMGQRALTFLAA